MEAELEQQLHQRPILPLDYLPEALAEAEERVRERRRADEGEAEALTTGNVIVRGTETYDVMALCHDRCLMYVPFRKPRQTSLPISCKSQDVKCIWCTYCSQRQCKEVFLCSVNLVKRSILQAAAKSNTTFRTHSRLRSLQYVMLQAAVFRIMHDFFGLALAIQ